MFFLGRLIKRREWRKSGIDPKTGRLSEEAAVAKILADRCRAVKEGKPSDYYEKINSDYYEKINMGRITKR
jgi:hypothetical protein